MWQRYGHNLLRIMYQNLIFIKPSCLSVAHYKINDSVHQSHWELVDFQNYLFNLWKKIVTVHPAFWYSFSHIFIYYHITHKKYWLMKIWWIVKTCWLLNASQFITFNLIPFLLIHIFLREFLVNLHIFSVYLPFTIYKI